MYHRSGLLCKPAIFASNKHETVLGSPFLNDYYQVYDMNRHQVGLVPSAFANNPTHQNIPVPMFVEAWIKGILIAGLAIGIVLSFLIRLIQVNMEDPSKEELEDDDAKS